MFVVLVFCSFVICIGASYIKIMLENNILQHLNICGNPIGDDGIKLIVEGVQHHNTLTKLDVYGCDFSVEGNYSM